MASASSPAVRSLIRDGESVANRLFRTRMTNLTATETVQNTGAAIRSLLRFNQTPTRQHPVFSENFPVMQEAVSEKIRKMEAAHGKRVVDNEDADSEEESDFDAEEFDDIEIDEEFEDMDEDVDEEENDKYTRKKT